MSIEQITALRYKCKCEAVKKDGTVCGHEWESDSIPDRCAHCKNRTWNRPSLRSGRSGKPVEAFGKAQTIAEWGREYKISPATILARIKNKWAVEEAIALPVRVKQ